MSRQLKAKFSVTSLTDYGHNKEVNLQAIYSTDTAENADFTKYTPSGSIKMSMSNDVPATEFFKPGKKYYVYFEEAPEEPTNSQLYEAQKNKN